MIEPADIFFVVTSVAIVVVSTIIVWGGVLLIRILRNIQHISRRAMVEGDRIVDDVDNLRAEIKKEGTNIMHFFHSLGMIFSRTRKTKKTKA